PKYSSRSASSSSRAPAQHLVERSPKGSNVEDRDTRNNPEAIVHNVQGPPAREHAPRRPIIPIAIGLGVAGLLAAGAFMVVHADAQVSTTALTASAKLVTVVQAKATTYRASRTYVATIEPWVEAKIGPQLVSAYVDT